MEDMEGKLHPHRHGERVHSLQGAVRDTERKKGIESSTELTGNCDCESTQAET